MDLFGDRPPEIDSEAVNGKSRFHFGWKSAVTIISVVYILYIIIYVTDFLPIVFVKSISGPVHIGIFLGLVLFLAFIITPAKKGMKRTSPPWYDIVFAVLSLVPTLYYVIFFESSLFQLEYSTPINTILGWLLIVLVWEASRRTLGWPFAILTVLALLYLFFGEYFPGFLKADSYSFSKIGGFMYVSRDGIIGIPVSIASKIIITFMLFAQILFISGAGDWFVNIANSVVGHVRGGPAKASVVGSCLLGMISPNPAANSASIGMVTIPMMKKIGFRPAFAAGVEAVSSTGGQIMPPVMGSVAFVLCAYIGLAYGQLIIFAFIPALLYYLAIFVQVDLNAKRNNLMGLPKAELPSFWKTIKQGYYYLIPIAILLICMSGFSLSAEKSAIYAVLSLLVVSLVWQKKEERITFKKLVDGTEGAMRGLIPVAIGCAGCGMIIGSLTLSLVSFKLTFQLMEYVGENMLVVLALAAVISFILGMGVGPLVSYLTLAIMVAPSVIDMGVPPLPVHLFLFYWAITCFITPPYALASFVSAGIARCGLWEAGFRAMRLGIGTYLVPFIFVYHPALLMIGTPVEIVLTIILSIAGIVLLSAGVEGYLLKDLNWPQRIILIAGGVSICIARELPLIVTGFALAAILVWHVIDYKLKQTTYAVAAEGDS